VGEIFGIILELLKSEISIIMSGRHILNEWFQIVKIIELGLGRISTTMQKTVALIFKFGGL
jgi:hypothetical protein